MVSGTSSEYSVVHYSEQTRDRLKHAKIVIAYVKIIKTMKMEK